MLRFVPVVAIGRFVRWVARLRKPGGGSAIPGVVVNRIAPGFLTSVLNSFDRGVVVVTGTAGKSTTTRLLAAIVSAHGVRVFTNPSTANIAQGLTSAVLSSCSLTGRINAEIAILEMDEGHAAKLAPDFHPRVSVLLNVCVDQIDRFFDPQLVGEMLERVALSTRGAVVYNADDDSVVSAAKQTSAQLVGFGMDAKMFAQHVGDMGYFRPSHKATKLSSGGVSLRSVASKRAVINMLESDFHVELPSAGIHYGVDASAALAAAACILGSAFDPQLAIDTVSAIDPVFGRGETVLVRGQEIDFVLVQNPTSYRLNVQSIPEDTEHVMIAVGSDVRDYSYLWSASLTGLQGIRLAAGPKAQDVALHALFCGVEVDDIEPDLSTALEKFLALEQPVRGRKTIIFSADSMRRTRRYLDLPEQAAWS